MSAKYVARFGKVWQDKRTGKIYSRELELPAGDNINNYKMVTEPKKEAPFTTYTKKEKKGMFGNE